MWGRGKNKNSQFRQYLLLLSSECCMFCSVKLKLFLSFSVAVKLGVLCQEEKRY